MKVLLTGGAGFIGSHLSDPLLTAGHSVRALDSLDPQVHSSSARPDYLDPAVELIVGDIRDHSAVSRALEGIEAVVHLSAAVGVGQSTYEIERYTSINALGTAVLLEQVLECRDSIRKVLVASSMSIYGEGQYRNPRAGEGGLAPALRSPAQLEARQWDVLGEDGLALEPEPTSESKPLRPTSIYSIGKRDHEEMVLSVGAAYGIPSVALRFFNVYGERQALSNPYTGVAAIFASRLLNNRPPLVFEDGKQTRDFVDVRDVARCCELALTSDRADGANAERRHGRADLGTKHRVCNCRRSREANRARDRGAVPGGRHSPLLWATTLAEQLLGFRAELSFEQGMEDLLPWLAAQEPRDEVDAAQAALLERGLVR
ncbi:MAG: NAD-dependent epimerase/dehydratase family protein [Actinomycetota bacterium]|nr:NAD-dependent epimerase/dehydratase family protein [Actinomycetota bacterium]